MKTYVNFKYRDTSGQDLADYEVEPGSGTHIPEVGEAITLEVDDQKGQYKVTERYYVYTGTRDSIRNQYITIIVDDNKSTAPTERNLERR